MRVLITGGSGMVGRNCLEHQGIKQYDVLSPSSTELNLLDYMAVENYLRQMRPDIIVHAAGRVGGIQANIRQPVHFLLDNLDMGRNLIWAAYQTGVKKLINLGSSCMYPRNSTGPLEEEMVLTGELEPTNEGYALAKVTSARLCEYIGRENPEIQYKTVIPCNLYGRWDKFDPQYSHLIPAIIHKIHQAKIGNRKDVEIWGDGTVSREFMYAGDLADFIMQAIARFQSLPSVMNVGVGQDYTVNEYYKIVAEVVGYKGGFYHNTTKPVGMQRKVVDVSKLNNWGWKAKTVLKIGIAATYKFYFESISKEGNLL